MDVDMTHETEWNTMLSLPVGEVNSGHRLRKRKVVENIVGGNYFEMEGKVDKNETIESMSTQKNKRQTRRENERRRSP